MIAIVYCSNTGHTAAYARLLSKKLDLPAYDLPSAARQVPMGGEILYLGWLCAGSVKGCEKAAKRWKLSALAMVGMARTDENQESGVRKRHRLPASLPVFYLQGGLEMDKLHGVYLLNEIHARNHVPEAGGQAGQNARRAGSAGAPENRPQHGLGGKPRRTAVVVCRPRGQKIGNRDAD